MGWVSRRRQIALMALAALWAAAELFASVPGASSQERISVQAPGMPESMKPQAIDALKNNAVTMPAGALAPAGTATANGNPDPFHSPVRTDPTPANNYSSQPATTTTFSKEQYEYLKNNAVSMQPGSPPQDTSKPAAPGQSGNIFIGAQVTGFGTPKAGDIIFVPSTKNPSKLETVSNSVLNFYSSQPARILLDSAKAAGGALAPQTPAINMLRGGAMTADIISAQQTGGTFAAWDKVVEKSFVMGSQTAGTFIAGPVGGAAAAAVAQGSYSTGKAIEPWLDSKLKMSDGLLWIDKRLRLSSDAKALRESEQAVAKLQEQVNAARAKADSKSLGITTFGNQAPASANIVAPNSIYTFKRTADGNVETFANGKRVATTTAEYAKQQYGYGAGTSAAPKANLAGFGVTRGDVRLATKTPAGGPSEPRKTEYATAPGKPANAVDPKPPKPAAPVQPRTYAAPTYRAPQVNCAQLRQQLYAYAQSGSLGAMCQLEDQLARYCGGPRGNACGGGGGGGMGGLGGFGLPF